ncbi:MAG TPA: ABC transporter ATP-binding protein [Planctomycetota bacterium]|jgi:ABC-type multidrug transport system fused ATPase/permease subunit
MKLYLRAVAFFLHDWKRLAGILALIGAIIGLSTALAWPMALLLDVVLSPAPKTGTVHRFFISLAPASALGRIAMLAVSYIGIKFALDLLSCLRTMLNNSIKYRGTVRVRRALYRQFQDLGAAYHNSQPQGDVIFRLSNDTFGPFGIFDTILTALQNAATFVAITAVMLTRSVHLTLFALSLLPLMLLANWFFGPRIKHRADRSREIDADLMTTVQRSMSTLNLTHAYNRQAHEEARFENSLNRSVIAAMSLHWQENLYPLAIQLVYGLGHAVLLGLGGYMIYRDQIAAQVQGGVTYGDLILFMGYFSQMVNPLAEVTGFSARVKTSIAASERVFSVLDRKVDIADAPGATSLSVRPRGLRFRKVSFGYDPRKLILSNVSALVGPGEMVAFIGASGAGKSTLLNLIPRFYDPTAGQVTLDGRDLRGIQLSSLRRHIVLVSQDNGLLAGTILENICYGNLLASEKQAQRAAEMSGAAEFIEQLPDKYQTVIAECGKNLSGGQRQRLAIARALLTAAPILIFDEPTSALDGATEQHISQTLANLKRKRTIILVTHRLASIYECDRIYVLHEGRIIEQGTYMQIMARKGFALVQPSLAKSSVVA